MAYVIITFKVMPDDPSTNLSHLGLEANKKIERFGAKIEKVEQQPIAFGIKALLITFSYDERKGAPDELEESCKTIPGVHNVEVVSVRRAVG